MALSVCGSAASVSTTWPKDLVGIENGVVVTVDDLLVGAGLQLGRIAGRLECREGHRVTLVVRRPVATLDVPHQQGRRSHALQPLRQVVDQHLIQATAAVTQAGQGGMGEVVVGHAHVHVLAAFVVVAPEHVHAGMLGDVQQIPARFRFVLVEMLTRHAGKRARHRHRGGRAARPGVAEAVDARLLHRRAGFPVTTLQQLVLRPRGFADHQHQQARARPRSVPA